MVNTIEFFIVILSSVVPRVMWKFSSLSRMSSLLIVMVKFSMASLLVVGGRIIISYEEELKSLESTQKQRTIAINNVNNN